VSGVEGSIATVRRRLNERHEADIAEMARLDRLIERHKRKRDSIRPPYAGAMLEEVFREIVSHTPGRSFRVMGPFGLGSEYGVSVEEDGAHLAHFTFRSAEGADARLVDTSVDTGRFAQNTLGRANGMHHPSKDMPEDVTTWLAMIEQQIAENRLRAMARE